MSEALKSAIQQVAAWQGKSAAELLTALTAINYIKKPESERVWSIAGIAKEFGTTVAESVYAAIIASSLPGIAARFAATGLDATDPQWIATADALIAGPLSDLPVEQQQALKYIGFNSVQIFSGPLSEAEVTAAKTQLQNVEDVEALRAEIENDYLNPAADGTDDAAAVRAAIKAGL